MNETTNPNSTSNGGRPAVDPRVRIGDASESQSAPLTASAAAGNASAAPRAGTPGASPANAPASSPAATSRPASTSTPASEAAPAMLDKVVQGAHDTVDRVADSAEPVVRRLGERVSATEDALRAKTEQFFQVRDEWTAELRSTVRSKPLTYVVGALALGALIARLRR